MQKQAILAFLLFWANSIFSQNAPKLFPMCKNGELRGDTSYCFETFGGRKTKIDKWVQKTTGDQFIWCLIGKEYWFENDKKQTLKVVMNAEVPEFKACNAMIMRSDTLVLMTKMGKNKRKESLYKEDKLLLTRYFTTDKSGVETLEKEVLNK